MKVCPEAFIFFFLQFILIFLFSGSSIYGESNLFERQADIGRIKFPGSLVYDSINDVYKITGSGENIWNSQDAFFFVYRKVKGDLKLTADIVWISERKHEHRKGGWMIRAGLEEDAPYVDFMSHGDSLISLQYRRLKGGITLQVQSPIKAPATMLLERHGDQFTLTLIKDGESYPIGTVSVELNGDIYAGLAVCSHDSTDSQTAVFSNVGFEETDYIPFEKRIIESTLEVVDIETGIRSIVHRAKENFEAPNWSPDGKAFYYNSNGKIYTLPVDGGNPKLLNTGFAVKCNNDHGFSPDGKKFVISNHSEDGNSMIYVLPAKGGEPKLVTPLGPSYWHGWSPDGKTLAYCAERNDEYDIYTISVDGGREKRLTTASGLDDGPDYSSEGKYIYFNSIRTGQMKIWRMKVDGNDQIQITPDDEYADWFAHPSPDGKWIVFLSYDKSVEGHPPNKDVALRIMPISSDDHDYHRANPQILSELFGGQGTINVPSWSPDSKKVAFVSYRLVAP